MIEIWSLDGRTYTDLPVITFNHPYQVLDGSGTGRMNGIGWTMHRQPEGTILNVSMTIGILETNNSQNKSFVHLYNALIGFGTYDFKPVSFVTPIGTIHQDMYGPSGSLEMKRITKEGVTYWGTLSVEFIAKEAYIT